MAPKPTNWMLWAKVAAAGIAVSVGGPALTWSLVPTEDELRSRYSPELLRRSVEGRDAREREFDEFVTRLKRYSKSDKPNAVNEKLTNCKSGTVMKEEEEKDRLAALEKAKTERDDAKERQEKMRKDAGL